MAQKIRKIIEDMLMHGGTKQVIIYPFGDIGMSVKNTLNMAYGVMEDYIVDNHLCMFNPKIHSTDLFDEIEIFNALKEIPCLFHRVKVDIGGYGISWNDEIDLSCDELWDNGVSYEY